MARTEYWDGITEPGAEGGEAYTGAALFEACMVGGGAYLVFIRGRAVGPADAGWGEGTDGLCAAMVVTGRGSVPTKALGYLVGGLGFVTIGSSSKNADFVPLDTLGTVVGRYGGGSGVGPDCAL